jgi:5-methylcytosine-specific restriction endonuclease McrA
MPVTVSCIQCGKEQSVIPARQHSFKFCSYDCRGAWRAEHWTGENNPRWQEGHDREKVCQGCGQSFSLRPGQPISTFVRQKFCSKPCADVNGFRFRGPDHASYRPDARRKRRNGSHASWARKVISRDHATCQRCGAKDVELHAHHIKPYESHPDLRWDVDNGMTLCAPCHWAVHSALDANGVNSGNIRPGNAEDNPEPSFGRKPVEGVTTRGRAYRRWNGHCAECGVFISKRWSDTVGRKNLFCTRRCGGIYNARERHRSRQ